MSDQLPRRIVRLLHMGEGAVVAFDERRRTEIEDILVAFAPNLGATSAAPFERRVREIEVESRVPVEAAERKTRPKDVARILQHPITATARGENSMETAGQEVGKIETRLRQLGAKLDRLVAKADEVGTGAEIDYRRRIDHVRDKRALVQSRLDAYKAANGQKWDSFKGGVETAWHELEDAYKTI